MRVYQKLLVRVADLTAVSLVLDTAMAEMDEIVSAVDATELKIESVSYRVENIASFDILAQEQAVKVL